MSAIRWLLVVPDPITGLAPLRDAHGHVIELQAPDRRAAQEAARAHQPPLAAVVVSRLEFDLQLREIAAARRRRPPSSAQRPRIRRSS